MESRREANESAHRVGSASSNLTLSISRYQRYAELRERERSQLKNWSEKLRLRGDDSPINLLEIEMRHIESLLKELNLLEDVLDDYLVYLNRTELICSEKNHLTL